MPTIGDWLVENGYEQRHAPGESYEIVVTRRNLPLLPAQVNVGL